MVSAQFESLPNSAKAGNVRRRKESEAWKNVRP